MEPSIDWTEPPPGLANCKSHGTSSSIMSPHTASISDPSTPLSRNITNGSSCHSITAGKRHFSGLITSYHHPAVILIGAKRFTLCLFFTQQ